jgi:transposase-like protein
MAQARKTYTAAFKAEVVREILRETRSISQLAAQYGIHPNQLYQWRDQALTGLPGLFNDQPARALAAEHAAHTAQLDQLYAEIGRLTTELNWLKKKWPNYPRLSAETG